MSWTQIPSDPYGYSTVWAYDVGPYLGTDPYPGVLPTPDLRSGYQRLAYDVATPDGNGGHDPQVYGQASVSPGYYGNFNYYSGNPYGQAPDLTNNPHLFLIFDDDGTNTVPDVNVASLYPSVLAAGGFSFPPKNANGTFDAATSLSGDFSADTSLWGAIGDSTIPGFQGRTYYFYQTPMLWYRYTSDVDGILTLTLNSAQRMLIDWGSATSAQSFAAISGYEYNSQIGTPVTIKIAVPAGVPIYIRPMMWYQANANGTYNTSARFSISGSFAAGRPNTAYGTWVYSDYWSLYVADMGPYLSTDFPPQYPPTLPADMRELDYYVGSAVPWYANTDNRMIDDTGEFSTYDIGQSYIFRYTNGTSGNGTGDDYYNNYPDHLGPDTHLILVAYPLAFGADPVVPNESPASLTPPQYSALGTGVNVLPPPPPPPYVVTNDLLTGAIPLTLGQPLTFDNTGATADTIHDNYGYPVVAQRAIWYTFTLTAASSVSLDAAPNSTATYADTTLRLLSNATRTATSNVGDLTLIPDTFAGNTWRDLPAGTYYVVLYFPNTPFGYWTQGSLKPATVTGLPTNYDPRQPAPLPTGTTTYSPLGTTGSGSVMVDPKYLNGQSWFSWTPTVTGGGLIVVGYDAEPVNATIYVYTGTATGPGTYAGSTPTGLSRIAASTFGNVEFDVKANTTYTVNVVYSGSPVPVRFTVRTQFDPVTTKRWEWPGQSGPASVPGTIAINNGHIQMQGSTMLSSTESWREEPIYTGLDVPCMFGKVLAGVGKKGDLTQVSLYDDDTAGWCSRGLGPDTPPYGTAMDKTFVDGPGIYYRGPINPAAWIHANGSSIGYEPFCQQYMELCFDSFRFRTYLDPSPTGPDYDALVDQALYYAYQSYLPTAGTVPNYYAQMQTIYGDYVNGRTKIKFDQPGLTIRLDLAFHLVGWRFWQPFAILDFRAFVDATNQPTVRIWKGADEPGTVIPKWDNGYVRPEITGVQSDISPDTGQLTASYNGDTLGAWTSGYAQPTAGWINDMPGVKIYEAPIPIGNGTGVNGIRNSDGTLYGDTFGGLVQYTESSDPIEVYFADVAPPNAWEWHNFFVDTSYQDGSTSYTGDAFVSNNPSPLQAYSKILPHPTPMSMTVLPSFTYGTYQGTVEPLSNCARPTTNLTATPGDNWANYQNEINSAHVR